MNCCIHPHHLDRLKSGGRLDRGKMQRQNWDILDLGLGLHWAGGKSHKGLINEDRRESRVSQSPRLN